MTKVEKRLEIIKKVEKYIETQDVEDMEVVSYGAEKIYEMTTTEENRPFYAFLGTFLSPQTRDQQTYIAVKKLHDTLGDLTPQKILDTSLETVTECIKSVGFYKTKAKRLKQCCEIMKENHEGKVPSTMEELTDLPGVGPKIAALIMAIAYNQVEAIAVDTHVFTISQRLQFASGNTPEKVRKELESWLPKKEWQNFNYTMVAFGQCCCKKNYPKCNECPITRSCSFYQSSK